MHFEISHCTDDWAAFLFAPSCTFQGVYETSLEYLQYCPYTRMLSCEQLTLRKALKSMAWYFLSKATKSGKSIRGMLLASLTISSAECLTFFWEVSSPSFAPSAYSPAGGTGSAFTAASGFAASSFCSYYYFIASFFAFLFSCHFCWRFLVFLPKFDVLSVY